MWMSSSVEDTLIHERIAEARRDGARRQLLHSANKASTTKRRPWTVLRDFIEAISTLWPKSRNKRMAAR